MDATSKPGVRSVSTAILWTVLVGIAGGLGGRILPLKAQGHALSMQALLWGCGLGGILGGVVGLFVFVFPKAEEDPTRWARWAVAALLLGFGAGVVASLLELQGALR
jgi:hypothetical protein